MAYIDREKFLKSTISRFKCVPLIGVPLCRNGEECFDGEDFEALINEAPTVDVVPRSEVIDEFVERLHKEKIIIKDHRGQLGEVVRIGFIDRIAKEMKENEKFKAELDQAKQEVAREIFEEIEKNPVVMQSCIFIDKKEYAELKKKYIGE